MYPLHQIIERSAELDKPLKITLHVNGTLVRGTIATSQEFATAHGLENGDVPECIYLKSANTYVNAKCTGSGWWVSELSAVDGFFVKSPKSSKKPE